MLLRHPVLFSVLLLVVGAAGAQEKPASQKVAVEPPGAASGKQTYMQYCATCHGENAKGGGPAAAALKTPPPDLTTLAKRHDGKFPEEYVAGIVRFGQPIAAHGSSDMPVWGPIFGLMDSHEVALRKRVKNLCDYLASLQEK